MKDAQPKNAPALDVPHQAIGGLPWFVVSKIALFFAVMAISPLTFRYLGATQFGMLTMCKSIAAYAVVVCGLGLNTSLVRFLPELQASGNKVGTVRLLGKTVLLQALAVAITTVILAILKPWLDAWFETDFRYYLFLTALLVASRVGRSLIDDTLASLYRVKTTSLLTTAQGFLLCGSLWLILRRFPYIHTALLIESLAVGIVVACGAWAIVRQIRAMHQNPKAVWGVGKRRTLQLAIPILIGAVASLFTSEYSEVFFIQFYHSLALGGQYSIGCTFPLMLISALPLTLQSLFTSIMSSAYVRDPSSLGRLVTSYFRILMVAILPLSAFGVFLGGDIMRTVYGEKAVEALYIAPFFFAMHSLALVSAPLSMAIIAREKTVNMLPLLLLSAGVNILLDWLLIPRHGVTGGMAAVLITFALTIPLRLYVVARLVGGIYFPLGFFLRMLALAGVLAYGCSMIPHQARYVEMIPLGAVYGIAVLAMVRWGRIIVPKDFADLRTIGNAKLNRLLDLLLGKPRGEEPARA